MIKCEYRAAKKDKLKEAFQSSCESITICLTFTDLHGDDVIAITKSQVDRLVKTYEARKGMTIKMSRPPLPNNMKRRRIFTNVGWIDPILNRNCLTSVMGWSIIGTGKYGCSKTNWNRFVF